MSKFKKFELPTAVEEAREEALSLLWLLREKGRDSRKDVEGSLDRHIRPGILAEMEKDGGLRVKGGKVLFTKKGEDKARDIVRRNRLAERMLTDLLMVPAEKIEADACRIEHVLSRGLSSAICTLLGHPEACPHGLPIPRGSCCAETRAKAAPVMRRLARLKAGETGVVSYLSFPERPDTQRLLSLGLVPGTRVRVEQRSPAFVVSAGENTIAMESAVAEGVFIRAAEEKS
ncbi:MAG: metal-dependent transcriptional regulator [Elusimicrobiota bacterium]